LLKLHNNNVPRSPAFDDQRLPHMTGSRRFQQNTQACRRSSRTTGRVHRVPAIMVTSSSNHNPASTPKAVAAITPAPAEEASDCSAHLEEITAQWSTAMHPRGAVFFYPGCTHESACVEPAGNHLPARRKRPRIDARRSDRRDLPELPLPLHRQE